jgi:hypothetical protein
MRHYASTGGRGSVVLKHTGPSLYAKHLDIDLATPSSSTQFTSICRRSLVEVVSETRADISTDRENRAIRPKKYIYSENILPDRSFVEPPQPTCRLAYTRIRMRHASRPPRSTRGLPYRFYRHTNPARNSRILAVRNRLLPYRRGTGACSSFHIYVFIPYCAYLTYRPPTTVRPFPVIDNARGGAPRRPPVIAE